MSFAFDTAASRGYNALSFLVDMRANEIRISAELYNIAAWRDAKLPIRYC